MIKKKIEQVLLLHFYSYFNDREQLNKMVDEIADAVRNEIEQAIATAIEVRFNGIIR